MNFITSALILALSVLTGTDTRTEFTAAGGTDFAFTWKYASSSQVEVYLAGVLQGAGYVVTPSGAKGADGLYTGGTVTFTPAPANGTAIRIQRTLPLTQPSVWVPYSAFKAKTLEAQLDALVMHEQQLKRELDDLSLEAGTPDVPCNDAGACSVGLTAPSFTGKVGIHGSLVYDFDSIIAGATGVSTVVSVPGAVVGSPCALGIATNPVGIVFWCAVQSANEALVYAYNPTASPINPASQTFRVVIFNP